LRGDAARTWDDLLKMETARKNPALVERAMNEHEETATSHGPRN